MQSVATSTSLHALLAHALVLIVVLACSLGNCLAAVPAGCIATGSIVETCRDFNGTTLAFTGITAFRNESVFEGLAQVTTLNINYNQQLQALPGINVLAPLVNLINFYCQSCGLKSLVGPELFQHNRRLLRVYVTNGNLESIPEGLLHNLHDLLYVYVNNNPSLTSLPPGMLTGLTSLQWIKAGNCGLTSVPAGEVQVQQH